MFRPFIGLLALSLLAPATASAAACDRTCLGGMLTQYVDAMVAHDSSRLPLASNARYTENSNDAKLGEGLWKTVTGKHGFRQDYLDLKKQVAASHLVLLENNNKILYSVLLYVKSGKIAGIETLAQRITPESRTQPAMLDKPLVGMNEPVPPGRKLSRDAMIRTALTYTEGLRIGSFVVAPTPFAKEAYRIENGSFMAGTGCPREQCPAIQTQKIIKHPDVTASVAAVDEENGVVLLWMNFGDTHSYGPDKALVTFEAFKVWGDEIHVVHAFFPALPSATQRGWSSSDVVPVARPLTAEARLQSIEDHAAIEALLKEYGRTLDTRNFAAYSHLFAESGEWKGALGSYRGPAAIQTAMEKIFTDAAADIPRGKNFHVMSNFDILVKGDNAIASSMFIFYKMEGSKPEAAVAGRYEDILIREKGVWRFLQRNALPPG
jgi:hypothetical protein